MKAQNLYIPGLKTTEEEIAEIKGQLNGNLTLFDPSIDKSYHPYIALCYKYHTASINLICHSMGCNYGIMIASRYEQERRQVNTLLPVHQINKMVFISPEIMPTSKKEKEMIESLNIANNFYGEGKEEELSSKISIGDIRKIALFLKTQKQAKCALTEVFDGEQTTTESKKGIPTLIVRSRGDIRVSTNGIEQIIASPLFDVKMVKEVPSTMHNPLLSREGPSLIKAIDAFLEK
jgi:hypothetical protein